MAAGIGDPHPDELEQEVTESNEVDDDDTNHSSDRLATDPPGGEEQKEEGDDEGGCGKNEFDCLGVLDDDQELHGEGQEEEEVELEESDVNLRHS